jgi:hypothetical protein
MNSRLLMTLTAALLAVLGLACSFAPQELLALVGAPAPPAPSLVLVVQALGAAWLGFAILDWNARGAPFGGIYGRPVALGNFLHFAVIALGLAKGAFAAPAAGAIIVTVVAAAFALAFGALVFGPAPRG